MKIKLLRTCIVDGAVVEKGNEVEADDSKVKYLLASGSAVEVVAKKAPAAKKTKAKAE